MSRPSGNADSSEPPGSGGAKGSAESKRAGGSLPAGGPRAAHRARPAVVSSLGRGQQRQRALRSSLAASVPAFLLAALVHAGLIWLVVTYLVPVLVPPKAEHTLVASTDSSDELLVEEPEPLPPELPSLPFFAAAPPAPGEPPGPTPPTNTFPASTA